MILRLTAFIYLPVLAAAVFAAWHAGQAAKPSVKLVTVNRPYTCPSGRVDAYSPDELIRIAQARRRMGGK